MASEPIIAGGSGVSLEPIFYSPEPAAVCDEVYAEEVADANTLRALGDELARLETGQARTRVEAGRTQYAIDREVLPAVLMETTTPGASLILDDPRLPLLERRAAIDQEVTHRQRRIDHVQAEMDVITRRRADHAATQLLAAFGHDGDPLDYLYLGGPDELSAEELATLGSLYADFGIHDVASQYFVVASELADDARASDLMLVAAYRFASRGSPLLVGDRDELGRTLHQLGERVGSLQSGDRARFLLARFHAMRESLDPSEFDGDDPLESEIALIDRVMPAHVAREQTFDDAMAFADLASEVNSYRIAIGSLVSRRRGAQAAEGFRENLHERVGLVTQMAEPFLATIIADERQGPIVVTPDPWGEVITERLIGMTAQTEVTSRLLAGEAVDAIAAYHELATAFPGSPTLANYERIMTRRYPSLDRGDGHFMARFDRSDDVAVASIFPSYLGTQSTVENIAVPLGGAGLGAAALCFAAGAPGLATCGGAGLVGGVLGASTGIAFNHWQDYRDAQSVLEQAAQSGFSPVAYDDAARQWGLQGAGDGVSVAMLGIAGPGLGRFLRSAADAVLGNGAANGAAVTISEETLNTTLSQISPWRGWGAYYASRVAGDPVLWGRSSGLYRFWGGTALGVAGLGYAGHDLATLPDGSIGWDGIHSWKGVAGTTYSLSRLGRPMIGFATTGAASGAGVSIFVQVALMLLAGVSSSQDVNKNAVITAGVIPYGMVVFMGQWSVYGTPFLRSNWVGSRLLALNQVVGGSPARALAALAPPIVRRPGAITGFVDNDWRRIELTADGARVLANVNATTNLVFTGVTADAQGIDRQNGLLSRVPKQWIFHRFLGRAQLRYGYASLPGQLLARGGGGGMEVAIGSFANPHSRRGRNLPGIDRRLDRSQEWTYDPIAIAASALRRQSPTEDYDYELLQRFQDGIVSYGPLNAAYSSAFYGGIQWESIDYKSLAGHMHYYERAPMWRQGRLIAKTRRLKEAVAAGRITNPLDIRTVIAMDLTRRAIQESGITHNGSGLPLEVGVRKGLALKELVGKINEGWHDYRYFSPIPSSGK